MNSFENIFQSFEQFGGKGKSERNPHNDSDGGGLL